MAKKQKLSLASIAATKALNRLVQDALDSKTKLANTYYEMWLKEDIDFDIIDALCQDTLNIEIAIKKQQMILEGKESPAEPEVAVVPPPVVTQEVIEPMPVTLPPTEEISPEIHEINDVEEVERELDTLPPNMSTIAPLVSEEEIAALLEETLIDELPDDGKPLF